MKLTILLILVFIVGANASIYSQVTKLNVQLNKSTLNDLIEYVEDNSQFVFLYKDTDVNLEKIVTIDLKDATIEKILELALEGENLVYEVYDRQIVLRKTGPSPLMELQERNITGIVTASDGMPIPGVTVIVPGTTIGALTDIDGKFSLTIPDEAQTLKISFVGMKTQEIRLDGRTTVTVVMEQELIGLDEVIITGYSTERKKDIVGSVSVVDTDEMLQSNSPNVSSLLQGRASGVFVTGSGDPGTGSKVRIRGFGSFGGSEPLYIIDGVPADGTAFDNLNPNDVESVQVLKDAAAASVYGARAASGVIIVSTKTGKAGKAKISVDMYTGVNYVSSNDFPELLNAQEYGEYWWRSYENAGLEPTHAQYGEGAEPVIPEYLKAGAYTGPQLEALKNSNPDLFNSLVGLANYDFQNHQIVKSADTDWFDEIFNPASVTNIQIGATGGSESGTYALSMSYYNQDDTSNEWAKFKRYTLRANSSFNLLHNVKIGENIQIAFSDRKGSGSGSVGSYMNPLVPVWDEMGNPASGAIAGMGNVENPITERWRNRLDKSNAFNVFGNVYAEFSPVKNFVLRTSFGVNYYSTNEWDITQQTYEHAENTSISSLERTIEYSNSWTWTNTATYLINVGNHNFKLIAGSECIRDYSDDVVAIREGYDINDNPNFVILDSGTGSQSNTGSFSRTSLSSLFGRFDYNFADKYLINATLRRDGSSKFGSNNRYGIFPAVGLGWRISQEHFMESLSWLTDLKLRGSYGVIGNQTGLAAQNQYYIYTITLENGYPMSGGNNLASGFGISSIGNPGARWEKSVTANIGFDATLLDGKYYVSLEYYEKQTKDLLVQNQAPYTGSSATQPSVNVGNMTNKGVDINLGARGAIGEGLSYDINANFGHYKNTVDKVLESDDSFLAGADDSDMGVITRTEKGNPISYIWGYELDGFFETTEEADAYNSKYTTPLPAAVGRWRLKENTGDYIIDDEDKIQLGSPHPDFQVGLNVSLAYRNFDFSTFIFWNQGGKIFNLFRREIDMNRWQYNRSKRMLYQSWDLSPGADNSDALLPKLDINDTQTKMAATDYYVEDATYVRMKTIQLGYTLPRKILSKVKVDGFRIYVQAQNLLTILGGEKPFSGLDPDAALQGDYDTEMGVVTSQNPTPRQVVVGLNLKF